MKDLIEILTWCRGAGTQSEADFVRQHVATIPNSWADEYGNYHLTIGKEPTILWSCHTDTVTRKEGRQNVKWIGKGILGLNNGQNGQCLGADDGAGLWLMLELIKAERPGHYVFHREEEIGGLGSAWISKNAYVLPDTVMCAIAMDRCGTSDVITHQGFQRTASDEFAQSLADMLPLGMRPDNSGVFTDTANYTDLIGECTNLACGYERNHGPNETLDTNHLRKLRDHLLELDSTKLQFARQPGEVEWGGYYDHFPTGGGVRSWDDDDYNAPMNVRYEDQDMSMSFHHMVEEEPKMAARLLEELGVTKEEFRAHVFAFTGKILGG